MSNTSKPYVSFLGYHIQAMTNSVKTLSGPGDLLGRIAHLSFFLKISSSRRLSSLPILLQLQPVPISKELDKLVLARRSSLSIRHFVSWHCQLAWDIWQHLPIPGCSIDPFYLLIKINTWILLGACDLSFILIVVSQSIARFDLCALLRRYCYFLKLIDLFTPLHRHFAWKKWADKSAYCGQGRYWLGYFWDIFLFSVPGLEIWIWPSITYTKSILMSKLKYWLTSAIGVFTARYIISEKI